MPKRFIHWSAGVFLCAAFLSFVASHSFTHAQETTSQLTPELFKNLSFRNLGPAIMGGRIDDFAVVESNPAIIYAATASGGLWKTVNNGTTWESLFDKESHSSIGDVTVAPSNPDIVWVGTGEANNRQSSSWGNGVYKSEDGGKNWVNVGLKDTHHIGRIVIHPTDPNVVYVAADGHLWGGNAERGLFKTTDGGKTWVNTKFINEDTGFTDVAMDLSEPNTLYAAAYQRRRTPFGFNGGGPHSGLYKTTDAGATWTKLTEGLPAGDAGRIGIDVWRKDSKVVYVTYEHATAGGTYRSDDKGAKWVKMSDTNPRPAYYSQIRIDPTNDQRIYVLGAGWYVSDNGGKTFANNRFMPIHGDYHALWINPANPNHLIAGSDGGIHFSYDKSKTWDYVNTIPLAQFYEVGFDMRKPYWVYGGLQDNGTWGAPSATLTALGVTNDEWIKVGGGDGFYAQVDPNDPTTVYVESQNGNVLRLNTATSESKFIKPQAPDGIAPEQRYRFDWNSPIHISPHNNRKLMLGGNRLFISNDRGDTWGTISPDLTKNLDRNTLPILGATIKPNVLSGHDGQDNYGHIVTVSESPTKEGVIWIGTDDGNVQVTRDNGKTWQNVTDKFTGVPANTYVTRVVASSAKEGRAYVTFDGHRNNDFKPYVFATEDFGVTWQALANNLPHPANVIREHSRNANLLLVGTEFGLWVSPNRGASWWQLKNNLPTVPVDDIAIHPRENDLILATHGRGIWILDDLTALEQMSEAALAMDAQLFDLQPATMWRLNSHKGSTGNKLYVAPNPAYGALIGYYLRAKAKEEPKLTITDQQGNVVREYKLANDIGVQRVVWDFRFTTPVQMTGITGERAPSAAPSSSVMAMAGMGGGGGFGLARAPRVMPGDYVVKLTVDGKEFSKPLKVTDDPRIQLAPADYLSRLQTMQAINRLQKSAFETSRRLATINTELKALQDNLKKQPTPPEALLKSAETLMAQISNTQKLVMASVNRDLFSENAGPTEQPLMPPVLSRLSQIFSALDGYTEPVAPRHREQLDALSKQLAALIEQANKIIQEEVPNLNKQVAESGAAPIKAGEPIAPVQR